MIEMLGVLAIIGVLSAGGIWGYNVAITEYRINQTIDDIQSMISATRNVFINAKGYSSKVNISAKKMQDLGIIPAKYKFIDPNCGHGWYCRMKSLFDTEAIFYIMAYSGRGYLLVTEFHSLPESVCVKLVTGNWLKQREGYISVTNKAGQVYASSNPAYVLVGFPLSVEQAKLACKDGARFYREIWINPKGK